MGLSSSMLLYSVCFACRIIAVTIEKAKAML
jgi:hypothetical protein